jgi:hypothetical protein
MRDLFCLGKAPAGATLRGVSFRPESLQARGAGQASGPGEVDYRLVRKHTLDEFRRGRLSKLDVCDAHPELLRAARNVGEARSEDCPICEEAALTLVSFAFGARLPAHGRCITTAKELAQLRRAAQESTCYVVEVCKECAWNQLVRSFRLGNTRAASS